ncbi:adenylate/guanylate cyclase domain-containing protein [Cellulophaga sp. Hel_I_12]|uniref:adenylate/guanylate cyclase domain-containing protein n=1 Tax=Cellulophaga sp. Hel_I_12 TaxID=1249972 RepID=UPI00068B4E94|nr:adenylate/guanylate cyclase domain-containing protein [Cellulophaga sp. Hel_I_12]
MKNYKAILIVVFFCFSIVGWSQNNNQIDSLNALIKLKKNDTTAVNHLLDISALLFRTDPDSSLSYSKKAIILAEKINFKSGMAYAYKNAGLAHYYKGEYSEVLLFWKKSLAIFEEIDNKAGISNLQSNLGAVYQTKGDDPKALDYFIKSVKIAEQIQDSSRIGTAYLNIGTVYSNQKNTYKEAFEAYLKSKAIFKSIGYEEGVGTACINMAELYLKTNEPKKALPELNEAIGAYARAGVNLSTSYNLMGLTYEKLGDLNKAESYQINAILAASEIDAKMEKTKAYIDLGVIQIQQKKFDEAILNFESGLKLTEITGVYRAKKEAYEGLSNVYSEIGDYMKAYQYQKLYSAMVDTLKNDSYEKSIGDLRFQFDLDNKEKEITLLNKNNELKQIELERSAISKKYLLALSGLFFVIIAGFFFQYRYVKKSHRRLAKERVKTEEILLNILPKETAEELKANGHIKAKEFNFVTVLFTDFKAFSVIAENISAEKLVFSVDYYFRKFDAIIEKYKLEKIKTIGDAYMCAGGLPTENKTHPDDALKAAMEILDFVNKTKNQPPDGVYPFEIRIGINTGPVVAGVVGTKKFQYDIWGSTVNIAARMESNSEEGKINISENTYQHLKDKYDFTYRGIIDVKNSQSLKMYFLNVQSKILVEQA